jgi:hypothetical protein
MPLSMELTQSYECALTLSETLTMLIGSRNRQSAKEGSEISIYTADQIQSTPSVSLTHGGILLIALLSGGDFDQVRLRLYIQSACHNIKVLIPGWPQRVWDPDSSWAC